MRPGILYSRPASRHHAIINHTHKRALMGAYMRIYLHVDTAHILRVNIARQLTCSKMNKIKYKNQKRAVRGRFLCVIRA